MLTTDGILSFAVMNYAEIGLEEDEWYGWGYVGVGSYRTGRTHQHPNSQRPAIVHIADEPGNTGRLGQWVFCTDDLNATATTTTGAPTGRQLQQSIYIIVWYINLRVSCIMIYAL